MEDSDIGAAPRLPDSKIVKNRMAVKFLQRQERGSLQEAKEFGWKEHLSSHLPSQSVAETSAGNSKIYINESLTNYRKTFFGRIKEYKKAEEQCKIFMDQ